MNHELLHHLEQRINEAVEEIGSLRKRISELEMQNYELSEEKSELQSNIEQNNAQQSNWESSLTQMLERLNQLDEKQ
ncbi:cell division protein ZapB [Marinomonas sp.]